MDNRERIAEVRLLCDDAQYQDFAPEEYERAYYRGMREIAKRYDIGTYCFVFTRKRNAGESNIQLPGFSEAVSVYINNRECKQVDVIKDDTTYAYYLKTVNESLVFDYVLGRTVPEANIDSVEDSTNETDTIILYYTILPDAKTIEINDGLYPEIPELLEEELLRNVVLYVCSIAAGRFASDQKKNLKYAQIFRAHKNPSSDIDKFSVKNAVWPSIKPYQPL